VSGFSVGFGVSLAPFPAAFGWGVPPCSWPGVAVGVEVGVGAGSGRRSTRVDTTFICQTLGLAEPVEVERTMTAAMAPAAKAVPTRNQADLERRARIALACR